MSAVSGNVDIAVAVELIASVEAVLAAMLTCSQSNRDLTEEMADLPF
jgi:hypothetical protein